MYGIVKIKKNKLKMLTFKREMADMGISLKVKTVQLGNDKQLYKAVYLWLKQKQMEQTPITRPMLCGKAVQLGNRMYGKEATFTSSTGWQWRFCKKPSLQGEKLSADKEAEDDFIPPVFNLIEQDLIFNCDKTGLYCQFMPEKTVAIAFEKLADGQKKSKIE